MLRTKFKIRNFEDWIKNWIELEKKLRVFKSFNTNNEVKIITYVGKDFFEIEIIINE